MIEKEIGYVISHEEGHYAARARRILAVMRRESVRLFGSQIPPMEYRLSGEGGERRVSATPLPLDEHVEEDHDGPARHDPTQHEERLRDRYAPLTAWMDAGAPLLLMVDGAVESAVIARPYGVPTIIMREHGDRLDSFHLDLYDEAHSLVAPFPALLEQEETPEWVRRKTVYCGGIVSTAHMLPRLSGTEASALDAIHHGRDLGKRYVLVILGANREEIPMESVIATAIHLPEWEWVVIGEEADRPEAPPPNMIALGDVRIAPAFMRAAHVVIAAPAPDTLAQIAFADTPYICIPSASPYNSQRRVAEILARCAMATVLEEWAPLSEWRVILYDLLRNPGTLSPLLTGGGARAVAEHIEETARGVEGREREGEE